MKRRNISIIANICVLLIGGSSLLVSTQLTIAHEKKCDNLKKKLGTIQNQDERRKELGIQKELMDWRLGTLPKQGEITSASEEREIEGIQKCKQELEVYEQNTPYGENIEDTQDFAQAPRTNTVMNKAKKHGKRIVKSKVKRMVRKR